jgi:restriction system protein
MIDQGLWSTHGQNPERTVNATITTDMAENGENSPFDRTGPGIYTLHGLNVPQPNPLQLIEEHAPAHAAAPEPITTLTFTDAAEKVLVEHAGGQPMHYRKIFEKMRDLKLIHTNGLTPEATLYAQLIREINRDVMRGETPRFFSQGEGFFGLRIWLTEENELEHQVKMHNDQVRQQLHEKLLKMPPKEFEELIGKLLVFIGFEDVTVTSFHHDGGVDVRGTLVIGDTIKTKMAIQVKRWTHNVGRPFVDALRGSLGAQERGLIITTSDFAPGAYEGADRPDAVPVGLMNGEKLINLLIEKNIGIQRTNLELIDLVKVEGNNII